MAEIYLEPQLVLAGGQVLKGSSCGYTEKQLWCFLSGLTISDAFTLFSDPGKTSEIHHFYGTMEEIYYGFTEIVSVLKRELTVDVKLVGENTRRVVIDHSQDPEDNSEENSELKTE